jgi:isoleucyl-tRNA synthetase
MVLAPFTPFLAEELYQKLTGGESVHLLDWPKFGHIDEIEMMRMEATRAVVNFGLASRAAKGIKVRQPLANVKITLGGDFRTVEFNKDHLEIIKDELNVKNIEISITDNDRVQAQLSVDVDNTITPELKREGMMREVIRQVQNGRKNAGLQVDDRIVLSLFTEDAELAKAIEEHKETIKAETLATGLELGGESLEDAQTAKVDGVELKVQITKAH